MRPGLVRPRTIVTADPELDDLNSMIRLVLYSNELQIEGLIYASSRFHWKGDGRGTRFFKPDREYAEPQTSWRWAKGERFIEDVIDAYAQVQQNLTVHDPRYPHPDELRACVREGSVAFEGDMSEETPGSRLIVASLLDDRPGPVYLQVWAGTSTVARALLSIEERYGDSPEWERVRSQVSAKAVLHKFLSQDETYEDYIRVRWPDLRVVDAATLAWGYLARDVALPEYEEMLGAGWMKERITSVGPLGRLYRTWGDDRQMVEGDTTDYFHLSGHTADELRQLGYRVWVAPQPAGEWISEGDTTTMLNLIVPGLRGHEHPSHGGWGGRASRAAEGSDTWSVHAPQGPRPGREGEDLAPDGTGLQEYSVTRWFADAQHDFAARLRWSISPRYEDADHHPIVKVLPGEDLTVTPGQVIILAAEAYDPDGGSVTYRWWHYQEAGSHPGDVSLTGDDTAAVRVHVPEGAYGGESIHVILEVEDDSETSMKTVRRVILTVDLCTEEHDETAGGDRKSAEPANSSEVASHEPDGMRKSREPLV